MFKLCCWGLLEENEYFTHILYANIIEYLCSMTCESITRFTGEAVGMQKNPPKKSVWSTATHQECVASEIWRNVMWRTTWHLIKTILWKYLSIALSLSSSVCFILCGKTSEVHTAATDIVTTQPLFSVGQHTHTHTHGWGRIERRHVIGQMRIMGLLCDLGHSEHLWDKALLSELLVSCLYPQLVSPVNHPVPADVKKTGTLWFVPLAFAVGAHLREPLSDLLAKTGSYSSLINHEGNAVDHGCLISLIT